MSTTLNPAAKSSNPCIDCSALDVDLADADIRDLAEHWIACRSLPDDAIEALKEWIEAGLEHGGPDLDQIAPGHLCVELDLLRGSTEWELMLSLGDAVIPGQHYLANWQQDQDDEA